MSGLFDDEGKTPARGRKHKAAEEAVAELAEKTQGPTPEEMAVGLAVRRGADPIAVEEMFAIEQENKARMAEVENISPGHPFEGSIKAAKAIADDYAPGLPGYVKTGSDGNELYKGQTPGPCPGDQVNRFPISQERRAKILNLVWERTRWRTGRVEWRDLRDMLKEVVEQL
jgi:hypothetical protein